MSGTIKEREQSCIIKQCCSISEQRGLQATAMSIDWTGEWVLLAGRRHLALQKLDYDEDNSLKKYHRNSKYDVSAAEWAICQNSQEYCALATSQLIEVVTWTSGDPTLIHSLRAHTRMVTDIDWHFREPHLLASCSIDTFTHLWDLRDPKKPILSLSAVCMSGATQVGFNRVSGNLLATAHDGDLRIWDIRKGSCPIQYITAHLARIHGINWSHNHESHLTTASQDGSVKYFDVNNPRRAEKIITTSSPVWRARYTPIGNGLMSIVVPHLGRGDNSLLLWSNKKQTDPICSFIGHTDVVLDFAWRPKREDIVTDIEFITWSRDQTLRLWNIDENLLNICDSSLEENVSRNITWPVSNAKNDESFVKSLSDLQTCSLQHEFSLLNTNIPNIDIELLDPIKRQAIVKISSNGQSFILRIDFPQNYPAPNIYPEFKYLQGSSLDENLSISLLKVLKTCAIQRVKKGRTCLEQCLRAFVTTLKRSAEGDRTNLRLQSPKLEGALSGALHDACIPFPRTSGVRFCSVGLLVTFSQPLNTKRISFRNQSTTPRALSAISGGYLGNVMGSQPVVYTHRDTNTFYVQDRIRKSSRNRTAHKFASSAVLNIYECIKILNISKELAENYVFDKTSSLETCKRNKVVAEKFGRQDLVYVWNIAELIAESNASNLKNDMQVFQNPFKTILLESLIMHFAKHGDIQTAVMLCCTFDKYCPNNDALNVHSKKISPQDAFGSFYHTAIQTENLGNQNVNIQTQQEQQQITSWSDLLDFLDSKEINEPIFSYKSKRNLFDSFKIFYADILYRWLLLTERALILKYLSRAVDVQCVEFVTECTICSRVSRSPSCSLCHKILLYCILCRLPVKGAANACLVCGHGGHVEHMKLWFEKHDICASGCGCHCLRGNVKS